MGALLAWAIHWRWLGGLVAARAALASPTWRSATTSPRPTTATSSCCSSAGRSWASWSSRCSGWRTSGTAPQRDARGRGRAGPAGPGRPRRRAAGARPWCSGAVAELGGDAAELGRLAGEQEVALRTLIRAAGRVAAPGRRRRGRPRRRAGPASTTRPGVDGRDARRAGRCCPADVGRRAGRRGRRLPRQRRRARRRPTPAPGCCSRRSPDRVEISVRDEGPGIPRRPARARPRPRAGSASASRSGAGSPTSAARATLTTGAVRHRVGARACPGRTVTRDDPHRAPVRRPRPRPGTPVPRPARRRGDALDRRRRTRPRRADRHLADGRARRAGAGAGAGRPRLRPAATRSRTTGRAVVQLLALASTATWPRRSPGTAPAPGGAFRHGGLRADRRGGRGWSRATAWAGGRARRRARRRLVGAGHLPASSEVDGRRRRRRRCVHRRGRYCARRALGSALGSERD